MLMLQSEVVSLCAGSILLSRGAGGGGGGGGGGGMVTFAIWRGHARYELNLEKKADVCDGYKAIQK